jgi:hypothetical protein
MLRFKVGELARLVVIREQRPCMHINSIVEINAIGVMDNDGDRADYGCICCERCVRQGKGVALMDWQLAKIDPPAEPASLTRECEEEIPA